MRSIKKLLLIIVITLISVFCTSFKNIMVKADGDIDSVIDYHVDRYYRGVWVTPLAGNIPSCSNNNIETYKKAILEMYDVMEYYKMNSVVFHIRIFNDALYPSKINPKSSYFSCDTDLLPWIIEEAHKRGIEFHAWLNPYRVKSKNGGSTEEEANVILSKCPNNVGANPDNLLRNSDGGVILNPGIPEVRQFIIDTCMEIIENYDVDAIHFDDYFYISNVDDTSTMEKYNPDGLDKDDWRRHQVDLFIKGLSDEMRAYNEENNRHVQLGISPSGVWRSAGKNSYVEYDENGTAITNGSPTTNSFEHYGNYLYSDTKKWIDEEWIDYITPQTYWAITHSSAFFKPLIKWWNDVCKYKKVNLYSGMGIYMGRGGGDFSWGRDEYEAYNQITYCVELENVDGTCIYNYDDLLNYYEKENNLKSKQMEHVYNRLWNYEVLPPIIRTMESIYLGSVSNIDLRRNDDSNTITFDKLEGAKFYAIYRNNDLVTFDSSELIDVIGGSGEDGIITYIDKTSNGKKYCYGVKPLSGNNSLGEGVIIGQICEVTFKDKDGNIISHQEVEYGEDAIPPVISDPNFVTWSRNITNVKDDLVVYPKYIDSKYIVNFYDINGEILETFEANYNDKLTPPSGEVEGYNFIRWIGGDYENVIYDLDIYPVYEIIKCQVIFGYLDPNTLEYIVLKEQTVDYFDSSIPPSESVNILGYSIDGWDKDYSVIKGDTTISLIINPIYFTVTFINSEDDSVIDVQIVRYGEDAVYPEPPEVKGMEFLMWRGSVNKITSDRVVRAAYGLAEYEVNFYDIDGNLIESFIVCYEEEFDAPEIPTVKGYEIIGWDTDFSEVLSDLDIHPIYKKLYIDITYIGFNGEVLLTENVLNDKEYEADLDPEEIEGYEFIGWDKEVDSIGNIIFRAKYEEKKNEVDPTPPPTPSGCKYLTIIELINIFLVMSIAYIIRRKPL